MLKRIFPYLNFGKRMLYFLLYNTAESLAVFELNWRIFMSHFNWYEAVMLICFGASWPLSLLKTLRVKNPTGKSLLFMYLILIGYISGILNKIPAFGGKYDHVLWLYVLNLLMVGTDLFFTQLYLHRMKIRSLKS